MTNPTRRTFLGAAVALPAAAAIATIAGAEAHAGQDAEILAAWERRLRAYDAILRRGSYFETEDHSPELTEVYDDAERIIVTTPATTAAGALVQAWVTWSCIITGDNDRDRRTGDMIRRGDFAALEAERGMDWEHVCMLQTIRSLRTVAGRA